MNHFEKIKITKRGELYIDRGYGFKKQFCPHKEGICCGEWCPHFSGINIEDPVNLVIKLCKQTVICCTKKSFEFEDKK